MKLSAELEAVTWTSCLLRSLVSSPVATVGNCLVLNAQGRALSKSGNMKEGDRKHAKKKFMNGILIQKIIGYSPFSCNAYLLSFSL